MQLRIYDTLQRRVVPFTTERPGEVRMYTCGPTVYRPVHLGNLRSYLLADWLRRALELFGNRVTAVKNITDVGHMRQEAVERGEDKVIAAALAAGKTPKGLRALRRGRVMRIDAIERLIATRSAADTRALELAVDLIEEMLGARAAPWTARRDAKRSPVRR